MGNEQPDIRQALRDADWENLLPALVTYASHCLRRAGWASGRDEEPSAMSVQQAVNTAVELCLDGTRKWEPSAVDLAGQLRGIIRSLTSAERAKYARAKILVSSEAVEQYEGLEDSAEESMIEEESRRGVLAAVEACVTGDADLEDLFLSILGEHTKRDDIAADLAWSVDRVTAARIKLQRRLVRRVPERFAAHARHRRSS